MHGVNSEGKTLQSIKKKKLNYLMLPYAWHKGKRVMRLTEHWQKTKMGKGHSSI